MSNLLQMIKDFTFYDYRSHIPGVICDIIECNQYVGFSAVMKVSPIGYDQSFQGKTDTVKYFNVVPCGAAGLYGFPTNTKELFYAYVLTDNQSQIEGKPAVLVPKNFLLSNPGKNYLSEPDMVNKDVLKGLRMKKETLIRKRKFS